MADDELYQPTPREAGVLQYADEVLKRWGDDAPKTWQAALEASLAEPDQKESDKLQALASVLFGHQYAAQIHAYLPDGLIVHGSPEKWQSSEVVEAFQPTPLGGVTLGLSKSVAAAVVDSKLKPIVMGAMLPILMGLGEDPEARELVGNAVKELAKSMTDVIVASIGEGVTIGLRVREAIENDADFSAAFEAFSVAMEKAEDSHAS